MDKFLIRNLEGYLSGHLGEADRREFESRVRRSHRDREDIRRMSGMSRLFESLDLPQGESFGPSPGFHARVLRRIAEEAAPSLWDWFVQPLVFRRVAFASCAWLVLLFSGSIHQSVAQPSIDRIARAVLAEPPESEDYCNVRLGCDIEVNRSSMLAAVMISGSSGR
ncbi:MAG: hypothetical protein OXC19_17310 [Bryobacterales bacterium]|nr:hypothetical protein [Bryobacterales bacterium]